MHGQVLRAQRVGEREHVVVVGGVVLVHAVVCRARRRDDRHERLLRASGRARILQVCDRAPERAVVAIRDRTDAYLRWHARQRVRHLLREEVREAFSVAAEPIDGLQLVGPNLEAVDALQDVVRPTRLPVLAVVDDIEADSCLVSDDVGYGLAKARLRGLVSSRRDGLSAPSSGGLIKLPT